MLVREGLAVGGQRSDKKRQKPTQNEPKNQNSKTGEKTSNTEGGQKPSTHFMELDAHPVRTGRTRRTASPQEPREEMRRCRLNGSQPDPATPNRLCAMAKPEVLLKCQAGPRRGHPERPMAVINESVALTLTSRGCGWFSVLTGPRGAQMLVPTPFWVFP